ncbi:MAG: UDP-3-O-(3-hydroxymyristoyl)glucosamine N-acyltransferase [Verrucomicrobia bacterium]|nr:UDP-3-O-(3-hydroxymyristoyl)glucosamine N-acyltransferase [Verrucomicrobiota bacterium]
MTSFILKELADLLQADLVGDPDLLICGVADLDSAGPKDLSFLALNPYGGSFSQYQAAMKRSKAAAIIAPRDLDLPSGSYLIVEEPSQAFQKVVEQFYPPIASGFSGIHPTAVVHASAKIAPSATIGPCAVIDAHVIIGANSVIGPHVTIGAKTEVGEDCLFHPGVSIREGCIIGNRVVLQPGAQIGGCGFGFTTDKMGKHTKVKQLGNVVIEDDVEIGANTTIDRARMGSTVIGSGTKIDNLVQIAHGVKIGPNNLIVGQTGIAGSTKTGRNVVIAGQVGVSGHIEIGDQVIIAARSGVIKSLTAPGKYVGEPAMPYADYRRHWMHLLRLERYAKKIDELEEKFKKLEAQ